jgi:hypothetical protein
MASPLPSLGCGRNADRKGEVIQSCAIITTEANDLMSEFHDRMPVILNPRDYDLWLDPDVHHPSLLEPLLRAYPSAEMEAYPVSRLVNDPRHEDPKCVEGAAVEQWSASKIACRKQSALLSKVVATKEQRRSDDGGDGPSGAVKTA